jgi:hypothetical protein
VWVCLCVCVCVCVCVPVKVMEICIDRDGVSVRGGFRLNTKKN